MFAHALLMIAATTLAAPDTPAEDAKKELSRLEGAWVATTFEVQGTQLPADAVKEVKLVCSGEKYTFMGSNGDEEKGTLKLDPAKKPKTLDIQITSGNDQGKLQLAIYELDGDTFKICAAIAGEKERPKELSTTKAGGGDLLLVFKREKKKDK
jgi:uncharacterized protein (TIGR03067 family)